MEDKYLLPSACVVLLVKEMGGKRYILCQRRKNTGFADGMFDFSFSGKIEREETAAAAAVREGREELGITISPCDLEFAALLHKRDEPCKLALYNIYFVCKKFAGKPDICEPGKCAEIAWFPEDGLPVNLIDDRREAFKAILGGRKYIEYGW